MEILAKRLKELRSERDWSQDRTARELNMVLRTYCRYETGEKDVPFSFVVKIADFYGVSLDYLAGRTDRREFEPGPGGVEMQALETDRRNPQ